MKPAVATSPTPSLRPISPERFGRSQAWRLSLRAGFGATPDEIDELVRIGPESAVDGLLDFPVDAPDIGKPFRSDLVRPWTKPEREQLHRARQQRDEDTLAVFRKRRQSMQRADRRQIIDMRRWWLERMIAARHPLQEKMTLFWHGHFATSYRAVENSHHMFMQNQLFRRFAVGRFDLLLHEIIHDPAMLAYLDNNRSRKEKPNENLARELMELFSLGVGSYTERDIKEAARALTGYTFVGNRFFFRKSWHDEDTKAILGVRGQLTGDDFVDAIVRQPACSRFIAHKLYRFFVADIPDDPRQAPRSATRVISQLALRLRRRRYEIKPVLRELFLSEHFYDQGEMAGRIKSPVELVVGAVRSFSLPVGEPKVLLRSLNLMGQSLLFPPSVAGWAGGRAWINTSTLFVRQNALVAMLTDGARRRRREHKEFDPRNIVPAGARASAKAYAQALLEHALGPIGAPSHPVGAARLASLMRFIDSEGGALTRDTAAGVFALVTAMPEFQLC